MSTLTDKESWEIKIDGKSMLEEYFFSSLSLTQEINRPNELRFSLRRTKVTETAKDIKFKQSEDWLGKEVEISFKVIADITKSKDKDKGEDVQLLFKGIIFNINSVRRSMDGSLEYEIVAYSPDFLLIDNPNCFSFEKKTLKDIVKKTLEPYNIEAEIDPALTDQILYTVQYNEPDYTFLSRLAIRFGEWFYYNGEKLVFGKVKKLDSLELLPVKDIVNYSYQLSTSHLKYTHHRHNYMDYANMKKSAADALSSAPDHGLTKIAVDASKDIYKKETFQNLNSAVGEENNIDEIEISTKAQALGKQAQLMTCTGTSNRADLKIGSRFKLAEKHIKDDSANEDEWDDCKHDELLVISVSHYLTDDGFYENSFVAIPAETEVPPYTYSEAYPRMLTQRAVVKENIDPEKLGRVRVQFLWQKEQDEEMMTPWIRIATPYAGNEKGFFFIPEKKEEVMVGFENGNAEKPYVIGSMYNAKQKPNSGLIQDDNLAKTIWSRSGQVIQFVDYDERDGKNKGAICIWDEPEEIYDILFDNIDKVIRFKCKGDIELLADGDIVLSAGGDIKATAKGNIDMKAEGNVKAKADGEIDLKADGEGKFKADGDMKLDGKNVNVKASVDIKMEGVNVSAKASSALKLEGAQIEEKASATCKVDGGGMLELKGGMVKIN